MPLLPQSYLQTSDSCGKVLLDLGVFSDKMKISANAIIAISIIIIGGLSPGG
jgi:hypothetical protein